MRVRDFAGFFCQGHSLLRRGANNNSLSKNFWSSPSGEKFAHGHRPIIGEGQTKNFAANPKKRREVALIGRCIVENDWHATPSALAKKDWQINRGLHENSKTACTEIATSFPLADVSVRIRMK